METIIFQIPQSKHKLKEITITYDSIKPSKLIKYGFNHEVDNLNLVELTLDSHYTAGLNFNFERKPVYPDFSLTHAEFWEILVTFDLMAPNQSIRTSHPDVIEDLIKTYGELVTKLTKVTVNKSKKSNLVLHKYSDVELEEVTALQLILSDLPDILSSQSKGSTMVMQLFSLQTNPMVEFVYYLSTHYETVYLFRPNVTSNLSCGSYLICTNLLDTISLPKVEIPQDMYVSSLSLQISPEFTTCIQCFNSEIIPQKIVTYNKIKAYLDSKVYEGATYQEMVMAQDENVSKWNVKYVDKLKDLPKTLTSGLERTQKKCDFTSKLESLFG